jgi:hypothetical protein
MFSRCSGVYTSTSTALDDLVIAYRLIHVFLELFATTLRMNMISTAGAEMDSMGDVDISLGDQQAAWTRLLMVDVLASPGVRSSLSQKTCEDLLGRSGDLIRRAPGDCGRGCMKENEMNMITISRARACGED